MLARKIIIRNFKFTTNIVNQNDSFTKMYQTKFLIKKIDLQSAICIEF